MSTPKLILVKLNGDTEYHKSKYGFNVLRKEIDIKLVSSNTEILICKKLKKYPQKNIVNIYRIFKYKNKPDLAYIDMEYLYTFDNFTMDAKNDIFDGLKQLHSLNIVYIDLHSGNYGKNKDGIYKLFDFDRCGVVYNKNNNKWKIVPCNSTTAYKNLIKYEKDISNKFELDFIMFNKKF